MPQPYITVAGDSLSKIAQAHGVGLSDILKINPNITNPNVIGVGQSIILPATATPIVPAGGGTPITTITPPQVTNGNNAFYKVGTDVFRTSDNKPVTMGNTDPSLDWNKLGLNIDHINPKEAVVSNVSTNNGGTGDGAITVDSILKGLGITMPTIDDGTKAAKLANATDSAKIALDDFTKKLNGDITHISNNPFLLSDEILGEQKRVIADNQDTLKTLTDAYNNAVTAQSNFQTQTNTAISQRNSTATIVATEIQRQYDNSQKTKQDQITMEEKIQELRNNTPAGQTFTVNGKTYTGIKKETISSTQQTDAKKAQAIALAQPELIKSRNGGEFVDGNVYLKLRTDYAAAIGSASEFDDAFSTLLSPADRAKYGVGKSTGQPSVPVPDAFTQAKTYIEDRKNAGITKKDIKKALDGDPTVSAGDKLLYDKAIEAVYGK